MALWGRFSLVPYKFSASLVRVVAPTVSGFAGDFGGFAFDARSVAGPFNALAFGLTIIFTGHWLRASVRSRLLIVLGCALVAFSTPVAWMASWALSEAVFIPLTVLALLSAYKFLRSGERSALIWAAVFSALACLTRYSGVVLVLTMIPLMAL